MKTNSELDNLIDLAKKGHFPLFYPNWISETFEKHPRTKRSYPNLKLVEKKVTDIFQKLSKHKSLERKRTALLSLPERERETFVQSFVLLVESKISDKVVDKLH